MLNYKITSIFPSPVYQGIIDKNIFDSALPHLRKCVSENLYGKEITKEIKLHGTKKIRTDRNVLDDVNLSELRDHLTEHLNEYLTNVIGEKNDRFRLYITTSWSIGLLQGSRLHEHNHPNSIVSGVLYWDNPDDVSPLIIRKDSCSPTSILELGPSHPTQYTRNRIEIKPVNGSFLLFPSNIKHEVSVNESCGTRYCLAFDTFVEGEIGSRRNILNFN
jgi:uncharacterized protein (TIGR02466 family)